MGYTFFNGRINNPVGGAQNRNAFGGNNGAFNGTFNGSMHSQNTGLMNNPNEFSTPNCSELNTYHFGKQIGHGAYAVVKECVHKPSGEKVAIKQYDRSKLQEPQRKKQAIREIRILSRLGH